MAPLQLTGLVALVLLLLRPPVEVNSLKEIPCHLRHWFPSSKGSEIPAQAFPLGGRAYVTRADMDPTSASNGSVFIGTLDQPADTTFFPDPLNATEVLPAITYDILANPEECLTTWVSLSKWNAATHLAMAVQFKDAPLYVGMVTRSGRNFAGQVDLSGQKPILTVALPTGMETLDTGFQILTSFSKGIKMTLKMDEVPLDPGDGESSAIGTEEIHNNGDVEIAQTFVHSKKITETTTKVVRKEVRTDSVGSIGFDVILFGASQSSEHSEVETTTETFTTEKITDITVTRTIIVPPFSAIQACSVVTMKNNVDFTYNAMAVYSAPGLEAEEILKLIKDEKPDLDVALLDGQVVLLGVQGRFTGAVALDAAFYVADLSVEGASCMDVQRKAERFKRETVARIKAEIEAQGNRD